MPKTLDEELMSAETNLDRALCMAQDLINDYFAQDKPDLALLAFYYDDAGTKAYILLDYLLAAHKNIEALTGMLVILEQQLKAKEDAA